jgi:NADPH:quinone reductase-like Zn-dependent oxidoreductase
METMMALRAHARGGPEQLVYERAPEPGGGPGEVLVAVHAAGITFDELTWDLSWTTRDGTDRTPVIPSHEVSGTVAATGPGVTGLAPGDDVYALLDFDRDGAAADYVTVQASALAARPRSVSHVQGGAGGVGVYAVQLAAILGGQVTATGRSHSEAFVRDLGAADFISSPASRSAEKATSQE